jgi:signal transduction histidine kinase
VTRLLPWAAVAAVLAGVTANVLRLRGEVSLAGPSVAAQVLDVAAGAALIIAGATAGRGKWLLAAAGAAWLAAEWANPAAPGAVLFTVGLIAFLAPLPLVLASRWRQPVLGGSPAGSPGRPRRPPAGRDPAAPASRWRHLVNAGGPVVLLAATVLLATAVLLGATAAALTGPLASAAASPRDAGCTDCPRDLIAVAHDVALSTGLTRFGGLIAIGTALSAAAWLAVTLARNRAAPRRWLASPEGAAAVAATAFAVAVAVAQAATLSGPAGPPAGPPAPGWHAAAGAMLLVLAAAVTVPALRAARARRVVARVAVAVADDPRRSAADALRSALGDAALRVAYPTPDGTWRDRRGQVAVLAGREVTLITDSGQDVAALIHGSAARVDPVAVTEAAVAARLLLDTERLEAGALARVNDLSTARRLVVEAADAARADLERDLHDGAQQRLVALRYALGLAGAHAERLPQPGHAAGLAAADQAAELALASLRDLAHGISPGILAPGGLADAVRTMAENAPGAVTVAELPAGRLPENVERTVYRLIADFLAEGGRMPPPGASIAIRRSGEDVLVEIDYERADVAGTAIHLADRVAAAGGQLHHASRGGRQRLIVSLPCA